MSGLKVISCQSVGSNQPSSPPDIESKKKPGINRVKLSLDVKLGYLFEVLKRSDSYMSPSSSWLLKRHIIYRMRPVTLNWAICLCFESYKNL